MTYICRYYCTKIFVYIVRGFRLTYYLLTSTLLLCTSFAYITDRKAQIKLSFIIITIFALFCGLRWYAGKDYETYIEIYNFLPSLYSFNLASTAHIHSEIGYKFLNSLFKTFAIEAYVTLFILALLSLYLKFFFYTKVASNVFFCVCFYLALHFYRAEFIQVRMALALSILCLALLFYLKKEYFKFMIGVLVASTMHSVSIVYLVLLIMRCITLKNLLLLAFILPVIFSFFSFIKPILEVLTQLFNDSILTVVHNYALGDKHADKVNIYNLVPLRHLVIISLLILFYSKVKLLSETNVKIIKVYLTGVILTSFFMDIELLYSRVIYLFDIVEPVVLCMLIYMIRDLYVRALFFFCVSLFPLILMFRAIVDGNNLLEYSTWLGLVF